MLFYGTKEHTVQEAQIKDNHFGLIKYAFGLIDEISSFFVRFRVEQQKNTLLMEKNEMTVAVDDLTMEKVCSFCLRK